MSEIKDRGRGGFRHRYVDHGGDPICFDCGHEPKHRPEPCWARGEFSERKEIGR